MFHYIYVGNINIIFKQMNQLNHLTVIDLPLFIEP